MSRQTLVWIFAACAALGAFVPRAQAQAYDLGWFTVGCGGETSVLGGFAAQGTIGQPVAGVMSSGGFELSGGFWTVVDAAGCGSADFNCDGDIGTDGDIEAFFACLAGDCPAAPCGSSADFDGDGDVGTDADIEAFFRVLAGGSC